MLSEVLSLVESADRAVGITVFFGALLGGIYDWTNRSPILARIKSMLPITFVYITLTLVGVVFQLDTGSWTDRYLLHVTIGTGAMAFAHWGQWFINDWTDTETDQHSNPDRPLATGQVTETQTLATGIILLGVGMLFSGAVKPEAAIALFGWILVAIVYTIPPFRLKDGAFSSMLCFGLLGTVAILFGSLLVAPTPNQSVWMLIAVLMVVIPVNSSYQDLPDEEGDSKAGIDNFVVRYGSGRVKRFLAVSFPISFIATALVFGWYAALPLFAGLGGAVTYLLVNWQGGDEIDPQISTVIGLYFISLAVSQYTW
ncbi:bacteriochlorophyll/chlorophyll a synthase [Haloferax larsenii JCM 13917]|nr:UbiA family prenyltransferase [Haloferax larsenii]ELZ79711.1 bacteriochlorophyll/chlorophyll a synthase [Haloferax larsenii JCM 13917]